MQAFPLSATSPVAVIPLRPGFSDVTGGQCFARPLQILLPHFNESFSGSRGRCPATPRSMHVRMLATTQEAVLYTEGGCLCVRVD